MLMRAWSQIPARLCYPRGGEGPGTVKGQSVETRLFRCGIFLIACACNPGAPPGAEVDPALELVWKPRSSRNRPGEEATATGAGVGTRGDNLPFSPTGEKLGSIAWRTWIYTDTGPQRTRLGYLRAGAVVDARGPAIENDGCSGGWYRINPRGFVCVGKGATTDLTHPLLTALGQRPTRGAGFPYVYAKSLDRPPDRYFKLPTARQMQEVEGESPADRAAQFRARAEESGLAARIGLTSDLPPFLAPGRALEKPYGVAMPERREVSAGRAGPDSGFALVDAFYWEGRAFGVTSELDLVPLDRTRVVVDAEFRGLELPEGTSLPVAFHVKGALTTWKGPPGGPFSPENELRSQRGFLLTGQRSKGLLETQEGTWVPEAGLTVIRPRDGFPSVATGNRRWIDISIKHQTLVAYVGKTPVYATLISAGRGGLGPKDDSNPDGERTVRGTFMIHDKAVSATMDGDEDRADSYELTDVPFVQYFHRGFAIHGAYWHHEFGRQRSHGCVNLASWDAAWLFEWTDPQVPEGWHGVLNKERGTVVVVGY